MEEEEEEERRGRGANERKEGRWKSIANKAREGKGREEGGGRGGKWGGGKEEVEEEERETRIWTFLKKRHILRGST